MNLEHAGGWHVRFLTEDLDDAHVCDTIRDFGATLECPEGNHAPEGGCNHIQITACDCARVQPCDYVHPDGVVARMPPVQPGASPLDAVVRAELFLGNWPPCFRCQQTASVIYMGIVEGAATFLCRSCSAVFAMDLREAS